MAALFVEVFIQIAPVGIAAADEFGFPAPFPCLHRFLASDGFFDIVENFIIDERFAAIFGAKF